MVIIVKDSGFFHNPDNDPRVVDGLLALYLFDEGSGTTVGDSSGEGTPLDLTIEVPGNASWAGDGLDVVAANRLTSTVAATKINSAVSSEFSFECWVTSGSLTQDGPARVASLAPDGGDGSTHNFMFGQGQWSGLDYNDIRVRTRTTSTDADGWPAAEFEDAATLTQNHYVYILRADGSEELWRNGSLFQETTRAGTPSNWNSSYLLFLANESTNTRPWLGTYHLVAFYDKALSPAEVAQNYSAGPRGDTLPGGDLTPPNAPESLSATALDGAVSLNWPDSPEGDLSHYRVYRSTSSGSGYTLLADDQFRSSFSDTTVVNDTTYYYVVTAVDTSDNESSYSPEASATPTAASGAPPDSATLAYGEGADLTTSGSGLPSILKVSIPDYSDIQDGQIIHVFAEHNSVQGISYIEAIANGATATIASQSTLSFDGDRGYISYAFDLDGSSFPVSGWYTFKFKAYPVAGGAASVITRTWYVHKTTISYTHDLFVSPSGTGDGLSAGSPSNIVDALATIAGGAAGGVRLKLLAGSYVLPYCGDTVGNENAADRFLTLERAPGLSLGDVVITGVADPGRWLGEFLRRVNYDGFECKWPIEYAAANGHSYSTDIHAFYRCDFNHAGMGQQNGTGKYPYGGVNGNPGPEPGWFAFFNQGFTLRPHLIDCVMHDTRFGPINCDFVLGCTTWDTSEDIYRYPDFAGHNFHYAHDELAYANQGYTNWPGHETLWAEDPLNPGEFIIGGLHGDLFQWSYDPGGGVVASGSFLGWHVEALNFFGQPIFYKGFSSNQHNNHHYVGCSLATPKPNPSPQGYAFTNAYGDSPNRQYNNHSYRHCALFETFNRAGGATMANINFYGCFLNSIGAEMAAASGGDSNAFPSGTSTFGTNQHIVSPSWTNNWRPDSNFLDSLVSGSPLTLDLDNLARGDGSGNTAAGAFRGSNETD